MGKIAPHNTNRKATFKCQIPTTMNILRAFAAGTAIAALTAFAISSVDSNNTPSQSQSFPATPTNKQTQVIHPPDSIHPLPAAQNALISFSAGLEHNSFESQNPHTCYYFAEVKSGRFNPNPNQKRTPLNIALVIDRSGSMEGAKLEYVKKAAHFVVDNLSNEDKLSLVIYDDQVEVLLPSQAVRNKSSLHALINNIEDNGSTNLGGGMQKGFEEVSKHLNKNSVNRVLLLTDGLANAGITEPSQLNAIALNEQRQKGISISTFGVGLDFNEDLLQNLAENGNGNYYFIASPEDVPGIFKKELNGLLNVVAQEMVLTLSIPQGISIDKVFAYPYEVNGDKLTVKFKDIFSEETKAVLIQYTIKAGLNHSLAFNASLSYNDISIAPIEAKTILLQNKQTLVLNEAALKNSLNPIVAQQVVLFETNSRQEEAMKAIDAKDFNKARSITNSNKAYLNTKMKELPASRELYKQDSVITAYEDKIKKAETMNESEIRYMQKSAKMDNYSIRKKK